MTEAIQLKLRAQAKNWDGFPLKFDSHQPQAQKMDRIAAFLKDLEQQKPAKIKATFSSNLLMDDHNENSAEKTKFSLLHRCSSLQSLQLGSATTTINRLITTETQRRKSSSSSDICSLNSHTCKWQKASSYGSMLNSSQGQVDMAQGTDVEIRNSREEEVEDNRKDQGRARKRSRSCTLQKKQERSKWDKRNNSIIVTKQQHTKTNLEKSVLSALSDFEDDNDFHKSDDGLIMHELSPRRPPPNFPNRHKRCFSQGSTNLTMRTHSPKGGSQQSLSAMASNESITSIFYPFNDQFQNRRRSSFASLNNSPFASGRSTPIRALSNKPIENPSSLGLGLKVPSVKTLPCLPYRMETVLVDRRPSTMNLSSDHIYLNGFQLTLEELEMLFMVCEYVDTY